MVLGRLLAMAVIVAVAPAAWSQDILVPSTQSEDIRGTPGSPSAVTFAWDETFDVGMDTGTPVDDSDYQVPGVFTGQIGTLTVDLGDGPVSLASMTAWMKAIAGRDAERPAAGVAPTKP